MGPVNGGLVVPRALEQLHQPEITVVLGISRALGAVRHVAKVGAGVGRQVADGDRRQRRVPARGVVGAAFPGVVDRDQTGSLGIAGGRQVAVPGQELRVEVGQEGAGIVGRLARALRHLPDPPGGDGMDRGLAQPGGLNGELGGSRGEFGAGPVGGVGEIGAGRHRGVEDDVGHHAGCPLGGEQRPQFLGGAADIEVRPTDGDECAVPAPLVGVEPGGGLGPAPEVVSPQHLRRARRKIARDGWRGRRAGAHRASSS